MKLSMLTAALALGALVQGAAAQPARPPLVSVSHLAVYSADPAASERFYVGQLGAMKGADPEDPQGTRYYFSPVQFVEVLPLPPNAPKIGRMDHVGFNTSDAAGMRAYLAAQRMTPAPLRTGPDGGRWFEVVDPEGNRVRFVQPPANPPAVAPNPLSSHIIHVGFIVHDRAKEDRFWRTVLGFRPYWAGGMKDDEQTWVSMQVPNGHDWIEYMVQPPADGRGVPPGMSAHDAGVLDHFALGVKNIEATYTLLWNGDRLQGQSELPKIGRDAKWQLNLYDPDGTRAEIMELHAIGKPCCTPFTAADPDR
jgi:catechol 2,3-dioxygenase-like lactoylglutathione lyase family enzyme